MDDENIIVMGLMDMIHQMEFLGCEIKGVNDPYDALVLCDVFKPDLIVTDVNMPGMDGLELMSKIRMNNHDCKFVVLSGYDDFEYVRQSMRCQALDYLLKPVIREELFGILSKVAHDIGEESDDHISALSEHKIREWKIDTEKCSSKLKKLLAYIDSNYNKDMSLKHMSDISNLHANYICTLFKKELHLSFLDYVNSIRLKKSMNYLESKHKMTINDIAQILGYQTERQFFRMFKNMTGITPGQYREQYFSRIYTS